MRSANPERELLPIAGDGRCRLHGGKSTGPPKGNNNAFKYGRYTAQAITRRREVRAKGYGCC